MNTYGLQDKVGLELIRCQCTKSDITDCETDIVNSISDGIDNTSDSDIVYKTIYEWAQKVLDSYDDGAYNSVLTGIYDKDSYDATSLAEINLVEIMLLNMCGCYGPSPRFGWIYEERIEQFKRLVDTLLMGWYQDSLIPKEDFVIWKDGKTVWPVQE